MSVKKDDLTKGVDPFDFKDDLPQIMKQVRESKGLSKLAVGKSVGGDHSTVRSFELDKVGSWNTAKKIMRVLGYDLKCVLEPIE